MQVKRIFCGVRGSFHLYEDAVRWAYMLTEKAKYKAKVLVFWEKHGLSATIDAYSIKRSTLFLWKKQLKDNNGVVESLNEKSKSPRSKRQRTINSQTESFILNIRKEHPRIGKDKVKALLDQQEGLEHISTSTIGRILSDLKKKGLIPINKKLSFYARTGNLIERNPIKRKKIRRKNYKPEESGDLLQLDTIVQFINGIKRYLVTAIDLNSDFAFAYGYSSASSGNVKDFFNKLERVVPFEIKRIQTDNGSEFEHFFREYIKRKNIVHFHNYPKCPKMNAYIERFNRTIQEEFINWNKESLLLSLADFNHKLINWLLWYNTQRPHHSLGQIPPMKFILNSLFLTPEKSNMLWTHTHG